MYKIIIKHIEEKKEGERYGNETDVYEQIVVDIDIPSIVAIVNKIALVR